MLKSQECDTSKISLKGKVIEAPSTFPFSGNIPFKDDNLWGLQFMHFSYRTSYPRGCISLQLFDRISILLAEALRHALEESLEDSPNCEGTGFYPVQSCANHSCQPNAAVHCETSNECILVARTAIKKGEEVCISYIDEDQSLRERQHDLQDYGFACQCSRCISEEAGPIQELCDKDLWHHKSCRIFLGKRILKTPVPDLPYPD